MQFFTQAKHQAVIVPLLPQLAQDGYARGQHAVVIQLGFLLKPPLIPSFHAIQFQCCGIPFIVVRSLEHCFFGASVLVHSMRISAGICIFLAQGQVGESGYMILEPRERGSAPVLPLRVGAGKQMQRRFAQPGAVPDDVVYR
jgi:hypothetical protein